MANLITKTAFVGEINLAKDSYDDIELFVTRFQPVILVDLLGYDLYKLTIAGASGEPYKALIDGGEYQVVYNGITVTLLWRGLKDLLAYYVYCEYMRRRVTLTQSVGETTSKQKNSNVASVNHKILSAWVIFEELYGHVGDSITVPSAYNYLTAKLADFPTWRFTELTGTLNSHDL